jgi:hypothetical protein
VQLVLEMLGDFLREGERIVARPLATRRPDAAARGPHVRTGTAQVEALFRQFGEDGLEFVRDRAQEDDVAGGPVHVGQARPALLPDVAQRPERLRGVEPAHGLIDAQGVEVRDVGEFVGQEGIAPDHASAVTHHAHDAAVLPVPDLVPIGLLELAEQVLAHLVLSRHGFYFRDETGPGAFLQFVQ